MTTLDEAWKWYQGVRASLRSLGRLADKHWESLSGTSVSRDDQFKELDGKSVSDDAKAGLKDLDDVAVFVLFSVFEGEVRELILAQTANERSALRHPALVGWAKELEESLRQGSFGNLLKAIKTPAQHDLIEQVNQVRKYRNWVAHGRRGTPEQNVDPKEAYQRLRALFNELRHPPAAPPA